MANRRMFSKTIIDNDEFLEMPVSARLLYFDLGMRADDDGFVSPKRIMKFTNATDDDLKVLLAKKYVLNFENKVLVIRDWKVNNFIRPDRYTPTIYQEYLKRLELTGSNQYQLGSGRPDDIPSGGIGKVRLELGKVRLNTTTSYKEGIEIPSSWEPYKDKYGIYNFFRTDSQGYILLSKNNPPQQGQKNIIQEHHWVWLNERGEIPQGYIINHKNRIRNDNKIENLEILTSSSHLKKHRNEDNVMGYDHLPANPSSYGDKDINTITNFLKEKLGGSLDGTQKENRRFAYLLLNRLKKDYPDKAPVDLIKSLVEFALKDSFHSKNATSFKYLYYNTQKILQTAKENIINPKYIKL